MTYVVEYAAVGRELSAREYAWGSRWLLVGEECPPVRLAGVQAPQLKLSFVTEDVPWVLEERPS